MKRRRKTGKPAVPSRYAGITGADCCKACTAESCVVSGKPYCGHPRNGGLQSAEMCSIEVVKRFEAAQKMLSTAAKRFA